VLASVLLTSDSISQARCNSEKSEFKTLLQKCYGECAAHADCQMRSRIASTKTSQYCRMGFERHRGECYRMLFPKEFDPSSNCVSPLQPKHYSSSYQGCIVFQTNFIYKHSLSPSIFLWSRLVLFTKPFVHHCSCSVLIAVHL
jgi:hypothetical protein